MHCYTLLLSIVFTAVHGLPSTPALGFTTWKSHNESPNSPSVLRALSDPVYYDHLSTPHHQNPIELSSPVPFALSSTCGTKPICPPYEGDTIEVNGRSYVAYCVNAPWGTYFWLPKSSSLAECEKKCNDYNGYDCNALTFYPSTGACSLIYSTDSQPYIWDNGYQKVGLIKADSKAAFGPGMVCPLPGSDNQVWDFGDNKEYQFKMSCRNSFKVAGGKKKNLGVVGDVDECGVKCGQEKGCFGFHYFQPSFPGGAANGRRQCDLIMEEAGEDAWSAFDKPNKILAGLKVQKASCGDPGWGKDEKGGKKEMEWRDL